MELIILPLSIIFVAILVRHYAFPMPLILFILFTIVRSWFITYTYVSLLLGVFVWWNFKQMENVLLYSSQLLFRQICCGLGFRVWYENGWLHSLNKWIIHFKFTTSPEYCSQQNPSLNVFRYLIVLSWCKNSDVRFRKQIPQLAAPVTGMAWVHHNCQLRLFNISFLFIPYLDDLFELEMIPIYFSSCFSQPIPIIIIPTSRMYQYNMRLCSLKSSLQPVKKLYSFNWLLLISRHNVIILHSIFKLLNKPIFVQLSSIHFWIFFILQTLHLTRKVFEFAGR